MGNRLAGTYLKPLLAVVCFGIILLALSMFWKSPPQKDGVRPGFNVVLISLDTFRADRVSYSGYARKTTPNIDRLSGESVVFNDTLSQAPHTELSHKSILTGTYFPYHKNSLDNAKTMAEYLKENGYETVGFVDGGYVRGELGFDRGFDTYDDDGSLWGDIGTRKHLVMDWLEKNREKKFFLFVHFYDMHYPYSTQEKYDRLFTNETPELKGWIADSKIRLNPEPKSDWTGEKRRYLSGLYDGQAVYTDQHLEDILEKMRKLGLMENTIVIITSDHGESLGENSNHIGHMKLKQLQLRVPLLFHLPSGEHKFIQEPVSSIDILPTVLDYLGLKAGGYVQGRSLRGLIDGTGWSGEGMRMANAKRLNTYYCTTGSYSVDITGKESGKDMYASISMDEVYDGRWKATVFNLLKDPYETKPVVNGGIRDEVVEECVRFIGKVLEESKATKKSDFESESRLDNDTMEQLREIGYLE